jgi:phage shock protein E
MLQNADNILIKFVHKFKTMSKTIDWIKNGTAKIVDVRTPAEFMGGHVAGSINIPLQEFPQRLDELKRMTNVVLCCASGGRSGQAEGYLSSLGIECENGGSWLNVNSLINK